MFDLRPYQTEAVEAAYNHLRTRNDNPCIVLPTGTGKSLIIAQVAKDAQMRWGKRCLVLAHVKELLQQNADEIKALCPDLDVGVYSAGLGRRDTGHAITVAGIQSVYGRACELGRYDVIIVDEAHLIPESGEGRYRKFLSDMAIVNPKFRLIGLTATPYRLSGGPICQPDNMLNYVCYEAMFADMVAGGYLAPLFSRAGELQPDLSGLHKRSGEFIAREIIEVMDQEDITGQACREILALTFARKSVLIFCVSVAHAQHVAAMLPGAEYLTGATKKEDRLRIIERFKKGEIKYLCNCEVLTTGFNAPGIDCIVLLRPTASAALYVQMVGRGTRPAPGKDNCLVLDYGENVIRHGPIDSITAATKNKTGEGGNSQAPMRACDACHTIIYCSYTTCPECGAEQENRQIKHETRASNADIMGNEKPETLDIQRVEYYKHEKRDAKPTDKPTMRVDYSISYTDTRSEYICIEHSGYARSKAATWWEARSSEPMPDTVDEAVKYARSGMLLEPKTITVKRDGKFYRIVKCELEPMPADKAFEFAAEDVPF